MITSHKYRVSILGQSYQVISDETEQDVISAVERVNVVLRDILAKSVVIDHQKVAMLAALRIALELDRIEKQVTVQADQQAKLMSLIEHVEV